MNVDEKSEASILRKKAEELLKENSQGSELQFSEGDTLKLIHELEVYQIELELQKEELMEAHEQIDNATEKFNELFDLHNRLILHFLKNGNTIN
jgi:hypothetical protein